MWLRHGPAAAPTRAVDRRGDPETGMERPDPPRANDGAAGPRGGEAGAGPAPVAAGPREPRRGALDRPAVAAEPFAALDAAPCDAGSAGMSRHRTPFLRWKMIRPAPPGRVRARDRRGYRRPRQRRRRNLQPEAAVHEGSPRDPDASSRVL